MAISGLLPIYEVASVTKYIAAVDIKLMEYVDEVKMLMH